MKDAGYTKKVWLRFYAELNDFLRKDRAFKAFEYTYKGKITVRDAIESLGVPHSAVDLVLVNSEPAGFSQIINNGDYISVYPVFESFDISGITFNRKKPLRITRFVLDAHLGRLARQLRMLGFDSVYKPGISDEEIINIAESENRIILTRDLALLKSTRVTHGYYIRSTQTRQQLEEIIGKFDLVNQFEPFTRCLLCNYPLEEVDYEEVKGLVKEDTASIFREFFRCSGCQKIYWEGSHYESMVSEIERLRMAGHANRGQQFTFQ
jgi:uncharacterized protein